jgi:hypothetical protein
MLAGEPRKSDRNNMLKKSEGKFMKSVFYGIVIACAVAALVATAPDIKRYVRISTM